MGDESSRVRDEGSPRASREDSPIEDVESYWSCGCYFLDPEAYPTSSEEGSTGIWVPWWQGSFTFVSRAVGGGRSVEDGVVSSVGCDDCPVHAQTFLCKQSTEAGTSKLSMKPFVEYLFWICLLLNIRLLLIEFLQDDMNVYRSVPPLPETMELAIGAYQRHHRETAMTPADANWGGRYFMNHE